MITAAGLSKRYGPDVVVDDVSFTCEPGTITGFLGPNGAGKSTTLRMITGLIEPDSGSSTVHGRPFVELPNPTRVVGTLLDASAMHPGRTGNSVLRAAAGMAGVPTARVAEVLAAAGLGPAAAAKQLGQYSLGMRQRLGIAQAMIGRPRVLILDEPANGLDPEGIAWMRTLLTDFADRGGTVLLSSHILAEVEATVDHLVVIRRGRVVSAGSLSELLAPAGLTVRATDDAALRKVLAAGSVRFSPAEGGGVVVDSTVDAEQLAGIAARGGVQLIEIRPGDRPGLEDLFFAVTGPGDTMEANR